MEYPLWLAIIAVITIGIVRVFLAAKNAKGAEIQLSPDNPVVPDSFGFMAKRMRHALHRLFWHRKLLRYEFAISYRGIAGIHLTFFCPRTLLFIRFYLPAGDTSSVNDVRAEVKGNRFPIAFKVRKEDYHNGVVLTVHLYEMRAVDSVNVTFSPSSPENVTDLQVVSSKRSPADLENLREGFIALNRGEFGVARSYFQLYKRYTDTNPYVRTANARLYAVEQDWASAEEEALKAMQYGLVEDGCELFRAIKTARGFLDTADQLRGLSKDAEEWPEASMSGVTSLLHSDTYRYDLGHLSTRHVHHALFIRRAAAARMLSSIRFNITPHRERLLHSQIRIHRESRIIEIGSANLTVVDSTDNNPAVTTVDEKQAVWILPELRPGDIIEWSSDTLRRNHVFNDLPYPHDVVPMLQFVSPCVSTKVEFVVPKADEIVLFRDRCSEVSEVETVDDQDRTHHVFRLNKHIPSRNPGLPDGERWLNPRVGITASRVTWAGLAASIKQSLLGANWDKDTLPKELEAITQKADTPIDKLEAVFYWIRDKLKYGVFESAENAIGSVDRGTMILKSGTADCKDRAYLLALLCRSLNIEWELIMTSSDLGSAVAELPADQFNHVFVRVRADSRWVYLDPTNQHSVFDSVPPWYQGMKALALNPEGEIVVLPEDAAAANRLVIQEAITDVEENWLKGDFFINARGHSARLLEERWKSMSLSHNDRLQATCEALDPFLPSVRITKLDQLASTAESNSYRVAGACLRSSAARAGTLDVARVEWGLPILQMQTWRGFQFGDVYCFAFPLELVLNIRFEGGVGAAIESVTSCDSFEEEGLSIRGETTRSPNDLTVRRKICIEKRVHEGDLLPERLQRFYTALEKALQLTILFRTSDL